MASHSATSDRQPSPTQDVNPAISAALAAVGLPMAVYDLSDKRLAAVNHAFEKMVGVEASSIVGMPVFDLLKKFQPADQREEAWHQFNEVASHRLMGYETSRRFLTFVGSEFPVQIWMRRLDLADGREFAVNVIVPVDRTPGEPQSNALYAAEASNLAVIVTDHDWRVEHASSDVQDLLGYKDGSLIGTPVLGLVHPTDSPDFLLAITQAAASRQATIARSRLRTAGGAWKETACFLTALCGHQPPRLAIILSPQAPLAAPNAPADVAKLEQHLWRIGMEVRAAGFLPEVPQALPGELPREFAELSSRQWEIVTRLVRGERAPDIAKAMFLSPTTVRNHLTAVFRKFGVHSQTQLLARLRKASFPSG